jgi:DnaJ domain
MTFCMEASGGTSGVRQRMKNALGRWSAQYQQEPSASVSAGVMDDAAETVVLNGRGGGRSFATDYEPEAAPAPETPRTAEAPPEPDSAVDDRSQKGQQTDGTAADSQAENSQQTAGRQPGQAQDQPREERRQEKQEQGRDHAHTDPTAPNLTDYYEVLQISRNADPETIHRVYRIMVARFHPDNPRTGDAERFQLLRQAYHMLSDPARRAEYDRTFIWAETHTLPIFEMKEFVDGVDGEKNRRLGILSLLYHRRRLNEEKPGVSVMDLEHRMGFPREYLNFTLWYLKSKGFVRFEDNSDYGVTVEGVDYLEANSAQNTIIRELLEAGTKGETCTSACGTNN